MNDSMMCESILRVDERDGVMPEVVCFKCFGPLGTNRHDVLLQQKSVAYGCVEHPMVPKFTCLPYLWAVAVHRGIPKVKSRDVSD